jgi:hypothetical protein
VLIFCRNVPIGCWHVSKVAIHQLPDDANHQTHEPRFPQKFLEVPNQLLTPVVFPTFATHGLASVWCGIAPLATPEAGKRQLSPSYSPLASILADAT